MNLHENKEAFSELIEATAAEQNLEEFQVEKDYYVSLMLKHLSAVSPDVIFKGGTSLSKCYNVIKRFSEDIDITICFDRKATNKQKKEFKKNVLIAVEQAGFIFLNEQFDPPVEVLSRRDFNKYHIGYHKMYNGEVQMIDHILIETSVTYRAFPVEKQPVSNYITNFLNENQPELIDLFELHPFSMSVQAIDRTFLDKLFAICDYHEQRTYHRYSRHIYDIHKIWISGLLDKEIASSLLTDVIETRRNGREDQTPSCRANYELAKTIQYLIDYAPYKQDFITNTHEFLSEDVTYEESIRSLQEILASGLLPERIS